MDQEYTPVVLMVDDEEAALLLFGLLCKRAGLTCQGAATGTIALDILSGENLPDLIVADLGLPDMDGFDFIQTVKSNPVWSHIPLIISSARIEQQAMQRAAELGADDYVTKPYSPHKMIELLMKHYRER